MARVSGKSDTSGILIDLGQAIRQARLKANLSQEALADEAGIDRSHMGKIERGERNVSLLNIKRIAEALNTIPSTLLEASGN